MNITLRQIRAFIAVAETRSFSQAARQLSLTQSALSGLIKELEQIVETKLFDRTTRQVTLSNMGERLLLQANRVLNEVNLLEHEAKILKSPEQGQVRLAVSQQFAASAMPDIIAQFRKQFPAIQISLFDCSVEAVLQHLQNNEVDLGIGAEREHDRTIQANFLFELPFFVVMPKNHQLANLRQVAWAQLAGQSLITLAGPFTHKLYSELKNEAAKNILQSSYKVNLLSTALGMTANNLGVTLCLPFAKEWIKQQDMEMKLLTNPIIKRRFFYTNKTIALYHQQ